MAVVLVATGRSFDLGARTMPYASKYSVNIGTTEAPFPQNVNSYSIKRQSQ